ncbi:MAG TPA: transcription termination/antitermination protein NusG [Chitinophagaceae bacterium]
MQDIDNIEESNEVEEAISENEGAITEDTSENDSPVAKETSENEPTVNESTSVTEVAPEKESKWYVLRVVSGKERKVKEYLDKDIIRNGWATIIKQIFLPVEKVYKVQNGKKVMRERNFYPGYVMIEVEHGKLSDEMVQHLSNISNVMHFLTDGKGSKGMIISLRKAEVNKMLGKVDEMADASGIKMSEPFIIGETIKIIDGPFNDFNGVIEEVNDEKKKLKVQVKIFGRATPVELNYMQVEKLV